MSAQPNVAAVIVSHNTKELLLECLASVVESAAAYSVEIIVVDNASSDGSYEAVVDRWPQARLIRNRINCGFGAACNQAIRSTSAPLILLLNSDARLTAGAFSALCRLMEDQGCGAAGCSVVNPSGASVTNTRNFLTPFNQAFEQLGAGAHLHFRPLQRTRTPQLDSALRDRSIDWIDAACLMLRRAALDDAGLFDERFFMYSEDEDLCFRLKKAGWSICFSGAGTVTHLGGASTSQNRDEMLCHFYAGQLLFLSKHRPLLSRRLYIITTTTVLFIKKLFRRSSAGGAGLREWDQRLRALRRACAISARPEANAAPLPDG